MELVGVVRSPLASFCAYGQSHLGRDHTGDDVARLSDTFRTSGCFPAREENLIELVITPSDFQAILARLGLTQAQLAGTLCLPSDTTNVTGTNYPLLVDYPLAVLHGRRRVKAGIRSKQTDWWAAKLLCVKGVWANFPAAITFNEAADAELIQYKAESFSHEAAYSDGTIYRGVVEARRRGDEEREDMLRDRLTTPKDVSLQGLLKNKRLNAAFQKLIPFPGLLEGLQLGNIHKDLALHCDEQIEHYLSHILATWVGITGGDAILALATDADTVKNLQFRAPSSCFRNRDAISRMIVNGTLWRRVVDTDDRKRLERNVLSLTVIIPSIETLHENMKYLRLGMKVVRDHFKAHTSRELPRGVTLTFAKKTVPTLYESLERDWRAPAAAPEFPDLQGIRSLTPYTAYIVLVLAALRDFPNLQAEAPRQEKRGPRLPANVSQYHERRLAQLAVACGFDNTRIQDILQPVRPSQDVPRNEHSTIRFCNSPGPPADWRGGRPFTKAYLALQTDGFLHILARQPVNNLCPAFVLCDFIKGFFDLTQLAVATIEDEPSSNSAGPSTTIMDSIMEEPTTDVPDIADTAINSAEDVSMEEPTTAVPNITGTAVDSATAKPLARDVVFDRRRFAAGDWAKHLMSNSRPPGSASGKTRRPETRLGTGAGRATSSTPTPTMPTRQEVRRVTKKAQRVRTQTSQSHLPTQTSVPGPNTPSPGTRNDAQGARGNENQTMPQRQDARPLPAAVAQDERPPPAAVAQDARLPPAAVARDARPPRLAPIRGMRSTKKLRKLPQDQPTQDRTRWFIIAMRRKGQCTPLRLKGRWTPLRGFQWADLWRRLRVSLRVRMEVKFLRHAMVLPLKTLNTAMRGSEGQRGLTSRKIPSNYDLSTLA